MSRRLNEYRNRYRNITRRSSQSENYTLFKDYIKKFDPNVVLNRIDKKKRANGRRASPVDDFDEFLKGIDPTDDLLRLNLETIRSARRKWIPSGQPNTEERRKRDIFSLRQRLFELMKHTVYRVRNKMVIMQLLRSQYSNSSLYKMGFLTSKLDSSCKAFAQYTYRAFFSCVGRRYDWLYRHELISLLTAEERIVNKWFEIELMMDLLFQNDDLAKETIAKHEKGRKRKWKFVD
ncbi:hypothetical protein ABMA28_004350 [Loxostege sticticalis]|uniref:Uncharacterized protein n=1 Tax=Loxostege sticticalis TaxID=481309 RepID=A0ABD0SQV4_LOXSC